MNPWNCHIMRNQRLNYLPFKKKTGVSDAIISYIFYYYYIMTKIKEKLEIVNIYIHIPLQNFHDEHNVRVDQLHI